MFIPTVLPSVALFAYFSGRAIRKYSKKAQRHVAESNTIVEETLQGIQNVIAFTNELFEINRYREKINEVALIVPSGADKSTIVSLLLNSMNQQVESFSSTAATAGASQLRRCTLL